MRRDIPELYDERTKRKFLLLPLILYNVDTGKNEMRWLEYTKIKQSYHSNDWINICWEKENDS